MRASLAGAVDRLHALVHDVAWVGRDNVHLTLKFLGAVESDRLESVTAALTGAAATCRPFELGLGRLRAFPSLTHPRVIWAGVDEGAAESAALAARVDAALTGLGFEPETRPYSPHVTLGRVRQPRRQPHLVEVTGGGSHGRQRVDRVSLMRSELSPRGARYTELAAIPLAAAGPESPVSPSALRIE